MKRLSCTFIYLLYIVIYFVYFILVAILLSDLPLRVNSDALLVISLSLSFVLAAATSILAMYWKRILAYIRSK
ncbi:MAG TPA: hypothetical protein VK249_01295 [Anaerolineales bacterium]|nr:hypothetical protein [Anaerolineales bacterium]